ncbi:hypothetical protein CHS0354_030766 [Potamilus streckersoni]|uniref:Uncharacterized protein n=1 Tax=Potamilus streckersoni TaxID=2493646 RepID=A0AAE0TDC9_9BIVA|nr:hypothetical protein CHS0354_030766 [Potamilus streckersoni]
MSLSNVEDHDSKEHMLDSQKEKNERIRESGRSDHSQSSPSASKILRSISFLGFLLIYGDILFDGMTVLQFIQEKYQISHHYNRSDSVNKCERHFPAYQFSYLALGITELFFLSCISVLSHIKNLRIAAQVFILLEELCQTIILTMYKNHCLCMKYANGFWQAENVLEQLTLVIGSVLGSVGPILMYLGDRYKSRAARRISGWNLRGGGCWVNVIDVLVLLVSVFCSIAIVLSAFCL